MSTDRPIHREQHQVHHHDCNDTSDLERRYSGDVARLNGHELVAIDEWLPGTEPTPYDIDLTDGCEYRTRYWRCRNCGHERNRRREFVSKKLVYEEFHYSEEGELEGHQNNVRAEFEYTCLECQERFHELPRGARSYYSEVAVLRQDLRRAIRVQLRAWAGSIRSWMRKPYRERVIQ